MRGKEKHLSRTKYKRIYCEEILAYFRSFLGYWERRLEETESRIAAVAWQERADRFEKRRQEAIEKGMPMVEDAGELLDPESIKQMARIKAYEALCQEMTAKRRLQGLPELCKWANKIGVTTETVREWRREHEEFDEACRECMEIQAALLKDGGLSGLYAGKTAIFLLQTIHGVKTVDEEDEDGSSGLQVVISERLSKEERGGEVKTTDG